MPPSSRAYSRYHKVVHKVPQGVLSSGVNLGRMQLFALPEQLMNEPVTVGKTHYKTLIKHKQTNFPGTLPRPPEVYLVCVCGKIVFKLGKTVRSPHGLPRRVFSRCSNYSHCAACAHPRTALRAPWKIFIFPVAEYPWECECAACSIACLW